MGEKRSAVIQIRTCRVDTQLLSSPHCLKLIANENSCTLYRLTLIKSAMRWAAFTPFRTLKLMSTFTSVKESVSLIIGTWEKSKIYLSPKVQERRSFSYIFSLFFYMPGKINMRIYMNSKPVESLKKRKEKKSHSPTCWDRQQGETETNRSKLFFVQSWLLKDRETRRRRLPYVTSQSQWGTFRSSRPLQKWSRHCTGHHYWNH